MFFELFQIVIVKVDRFESLFEKFGIDDVTSFRWFFIFFPKIEYILRVFSEKYQNHSDDNPDNYSKKNNKCSHILSLPNK